MQRSGMTKSLNCDWEWECEDLVGHEDTDWPCDRIFKEWYFIIQEKKNEMNNNRCVMPIWYKDSRKGKRESQKYQALKREVKWIWHCQNLSIVPVIIKALDTFFNPSRAR